MKILNDIACNLNWIGILKFDWNLMNLKIKEFHPIFKFEWIQFKFSWREMGHKLVQKVLKICLWLWCLKEKKKTLKRHKSEKTPFHSSLLGEWLTKGWLIEHKVVLVPMNPHHWNSQILELGFCGQSRIVVIYQVLARNIFVSGQSF